MNDHPADSASPKPGADAQRDALDRSERAAERERPQNYKDKQTAEKVVEVLPPDADGTPIQGIDPDR